MIQRVYTCLYTLFSCCTRLNLSELVITCLNSHIQHYTNALTLSVMVGKLMGGALGMALMDPIHRYAGVTPHLTVGPSLALRHATRTDGAAWAVWQFRQASYCTILRFTHVSGGLGGCWQCGAP